MPRCGWPWPPTWPGSRVNRALTPSPICVPTWPGAATAIWTLQARRPHVELYLRWMQEARRYQPSTVSRRLSIVAGFYRTCVIDDLLEHSPADHVRRPARATSSPPSRSHPQWIAPSTVKPLTGMLGPILRSRAGSRMSRHAATRRLHNLSRTTAIGGPTAHRQTSAHSAACACVAEGNVRPPAG